MSVESVEQKEVVVWHIVLEALKQRGFSQVEGTEQWQTHWGFKYENLEALLKDNLVRLFGSDPRKSFCDPKGAQYGEPLVVANDRRISQQNAEAMKIWAEWEDKRMERILSLVTEIQRSRRLAEALRGVLALAVIDAGNENHTYALAEGHLAFQDWLETAP